MPFSSEIACFFKRALIKKCSFIWKNNAGNLSEETIKMWQILVMTELVCVQWKHSNINCFVLWSVSGLRFARLERGDGLTDRGGKGVGLKTYTHSSAPSSVLPTITSQMSIWFAKDDFIPASQTSPNKYYCIYRYEVKCDTLWYFIWSHKVEYLFIIFIISFFVKKSNSKEKWKYLIALQFFLTKQLV